MALCCFICYFSGSIINVLGWWSFLCFLHHICFFWGVCACTLSFLHVRGLHVGGEMALFKWERKALEGNKKAWKLCTWEGRTTRGISIAQSASICPPVWEPGCGEGGGISLSRLWLSLVVFSWAPHPCSELCLESTLPEGKFPVSCLGINGREENMGT